MKILSDATISKIDFEVEAAKQAAMHVSHSEKFQELSAQFTQHKLLIGGVFCANAILTLVLKFL